MVFSAIGLAGKTIDVATNVFRTAVDLGTKENSEGFILRQDLRSGLLFGVTHRKPVGVAAVITDDQRSVDERFHHAPPWSQAILEYRTGNVTMSSSPCISRYSGTGPTNVLAALDIKTLVDLPVCESVQDHHGMLLGLALKEGSRSSSAGQRSNVMSRWSTNMEGTGTGDVMACTINISPTPEIPGSRPASLLGVLNQNFSRGSVHIRSADPKALARLEMNLLSDERDLSRFREMYRHLGEILQQPALRGIVERVDDSNGDELDLELRGNKLDARLKLLVQDTAHAAGSCKMGSSDDARTVVDGQCRVLGVDGLRVVDASIMPSVTRANTNIAAVMIGERAADLLLNGERTSRNLVTAHPAPR